MGYVNESVTPVQQEEDLINQKIAEQEHSIMSHLKKMDLYAKVLQLTTTEKPFKHPPVFNEFMPDEDELMTSLQQKLMTCMQLKLMTCMQQKLMERKEDMPPKGFEWGDGMALVDVVIACGQMIGETFGVHVTKLAEMMRSFKQFMEVMKKKIFE